MRIENANELQQRLNTAWKTLNDLASARDKLYAQLDQIYSSDSYTESGAPYSTSTPVTVE